MNNILVTGIESTGRCICNLLFFSAVLFISAGVVSAAPSISNTTDNRASYPNNQIPVYEKFEVTFSLSTVSQHPFFPYDEMLTPVPGLTPKRGVSVDGIFLPPGETDWNKAYKQPGFYYIEYNENPNGTALYYPTGVTYWKVRFAPPACPGNTYPCTWQYKLTARDLSGITESPVKTVTVSQSSNHGFIRVSKRDPRYFEFSDGTYFPGLAINESIDKNDPVNGNTDLLQQMGTNGIQVMRFWLSSWTIYGSTWTTWEGIKGTYDGYLPRAGLITNRAESTSTQPSSVMTIVYSEGIDPQDGEYKRNMGSWFDACHLTVSGGSQIRIATKPNTKYHIKIRYQARGITGPRNSKYPGYGLVLKRQNPNDGNWHRGCFDGGDPENGVKMSGYGHDTPQWSQGTNGIWSSSNWATLESDWTATGDAMPILYLAMENANNITATIDGGKAYNWHPYASIDSIEFREINANGTYGPNIMPRESMSYLETMMDKNAYAFDKTLELAKQKGVYLKTVILDKNEQTANEIGQDGLSSEFNNNNLFGNWRKIGAVRWYQQAWWRYLQARWGYSTAIHSWELVNEGEPYNSQHWTLTDELAKYMKCLAFGVPVASADGSICNYVHPNAHMSTTSFWYGFPRNEFWANPAYPNVDYTDVHDYINKPSEPDHFYDTALSTYDLGKLYGATQATGAGKPVIRGETALIVDDGTDSMATEFDGTGDHGRVLDRKGIWLHNFIWGGINQYGATEAWWHTSQIYSGAKDLRPLFKHYYDFISNVPLSNGTYQDAAAIATDSNIRVWGQKDSRIQEASHVHIWIQNKKHLWCAVNKIVGCPVTWDNSRLTGTVTISGFKANTTYPLEWWHFDNNVTLTKSTGQTINSNANGQIVLNLDQLPAQVVDTGVKIGNYNIAVTVTPPTPTTSATLPCTKPGDTKQGTGCDNNVNIFDFNFLSSHFATQSGEARYDAGADLNADKMINIQDFVILSSNFGT